MEKSQLQACQ